MVITRNEELTNNTDEDTIEVGSFVRATGYIPSLNPDDCIQSPENTLGRVVFVYVNIEWPYEIQFITGEYVACNLFEIKLVKELSKEEELQWSLFIMKH